MRRCLLRRTALPLLLAVVLLGGGCAREIVGSAPPLDRPHFPTGLALHPERPLLVVVSSNFDLAFNRGALLLADLDEVDAAITAAGDDLARVVNPYAAAALIPSFGNEPVFVDDGRSILLPSRDENRVSEIPLVGGDDIGFDCAPSPEPSVDAPSCGEPTDSLQVGGNDPFKLAVVEQTESRVTAIVTLQSSPEVVYLALDLEAASDRMTVLTGPSFSLEDYTLSGDALGVWGIALRPAQGGVAQTAFMTVRRTTTDLPTDAVDLVWFNAAQGGGVNPANVLELTDEIGSIDARDISLHPSGEALFVLLRDPDALARVDLFPAGGSLEARLAGVVNTCYDPIEVEAVNLTTPAGDQATRVVVTCFDNDTVLSYDALTLVETEALRGFGDGPYGLAVDAAHVPPRAYVSFFNDDQVGVIDLIGDDGEIRLVPRALLGERRQAVEAVQ